MKNNYLSFLNKNLFFFYVLFLIKKLIYIYKEILIYDVRFYIK